MAKGIQVVAEADVADATAAFMRHAQTIKAAGGTMKEFEKAIAAAVKELDKKKRAAQESGAAVSGLAQSLGGFVSASEIIAAVTQAFTGMRDRIREAAAELKNLKPGLQQVALAAGSPEQAGGLVDLARRVAQRTGIPDADSLGIVAQATKAGFGSEQDVLAFARAQQASGVPASSMIETASKVNEVYGGAYTGENVVNLLLQAAGSQGANFGDVTANAESLFLAGSQRGMSAEAVATLVAKVGEYTSGQRALAGVRGALSGDAEVGATPEIRLAQMVMRSPEFAADVSAASDSMYRGDQLPALERRAAAAGLGPILRREQRAVVGNQQLRPAADVDADVRALRESAQSSRSQAFDDAGAVGRAQLIREGIMSAIDRLWADAFYTSRGRLADAVEEERIARQFLRRYRELSAVEVRGVGNASPEVAP